MDRMASREAAPDRGAGAAAPSRPVSCAAAPSRRLACVVVPALPLQLLLRARPRWAGHPAAVLERDSPQGRVLWANAPARAAGIAPGMRYAAALSLAGALRAAVVAPEEIDGAVEALTTRLLAFSPVVEPAREEGAGAGPGTFWLDAAGLDLLYGAGEGGALESWARQLASAVQRDEGLECAVVVGFSRFAACALARARAPGAVVLATPCQERRAAGEVPLERLAMDAAGREILDKLGVRTLGQFADLPPESIERRFGKAVRRLHRLARGELHAPLAPHRPDPPPARRAQFETPESDAVRLAARIDELIVELLEELARRELGLVELALALHLESGGRHVETLRPAAPTLDRRQVSELVTLRLAAARLPLEFPSDGVVDLEVTARGRGIAREQLDLFADLLAPRRRRDALAAARALARIRADLGDDAVRTARLAEGHLPEACFRWERRDADRDAAGAPAPLARPFLVRRILARPQALPPRPRQEPDGWMLRGLEQGPVVRVLGPYVISGGWWSRATHREYHFAETGKGEILWVYYDRERRRWFLQGRVE